MVFQWICVGFNTSTVVLFISTVIVLILYNCIWKNWWYFSVRNTKFIRGWPLIGSLHDFFLGKKSFADSVVSFYRAYPNESFIGVYELTHPVFIIRDPDLIKKITTPDFDYLANHQGNFDDEFDSLISRSLFFTRNHNKWKKMRSILSASFTGNKMRGLFDLVCDSTSKFVPKLKLEIKSENGLEIESKDLFTRYMTNIIATCAFGLEVDAVSDRDNQFYLSGKSITNFDGIQGIKLLLLDVIPKIMRFLRIQFFDTKLCRYFRDVVVSTMSYREKNNIFRPDMIHLMMQARKEAVQEDENDDENRKTSMYSNVFVTKKRVDF